MDGGGTRGATPDMTPAGSSALAMSRSEAEAALRAAGKADDDKIDIAGTALAFATRGRAEAGDARYRRHLLLLAGDVAQVGAGASDIHAQVEALQRVLVDVHGYGGDRTTYDDLRNADLAHVIDRKCGLPVALAILWLHAARAQGWALHGINFPAHFLLQLECAGERVFLDPFNGGRTLDPAELESMLKAMTGAEAVLAGEHCTPMSNRGILLRLQNNIKMRLLKANSLAEALTVLEGMLMLAPDKAGLWREAGLIHAQAENLRAAQTCLANAVELAEKGPTRQRIAAELATVRSKLN